MVKIIDFKSRLVESAHVRPEGLPLPLLDMDEGVRTLAWLLTAGEVGNKGLAQLVKGLDGTWFEVGASVVRELPQSKEKSDSIRRPWSMTYSCLKSGLSYITYSC